MKGEQMKKVTVNWHLYHGENYKLHYIEGALIEPEPFLSYITEKKKYRQEEIAHYLSCYAFLDFCKNMYVLRAPADLTITIDPKTKVVRSHNFDQTFFDNCVIFRDWGNEIGLSLGPSIVFNSDESVIMESIPLMLGASKATENMNLIPGRMDIGKVVRPIDFSGEVIDITKPIEIRRGDPLLMLRFITKDDAPIQFNRVVQEERHIKAVAASVGFKMCKRKTPLPKLYETLDPILRLLGFKSKIDKEQ